MKFSKIAILGPGLLGGSLALAVKARGLCGSLSLYARRPEAAEALRRSSLDALISTDPIQVVQDAELVIFAVPIGIMPELTERIKGALDPFSIVTDVGSVKGPVVAQMEESLAGVAKWVGSHPMAGSEKSGFDAAREDLFVGARTIVTPTAATDSSALETVITFWQSLGCTVSTCSPEEHDRRVAQISHLPHLLASALVRSTEPESLEFRGPGFRDTTRVAAGPAPMWSEILINNQEAVRESILRLRKELTTVESLIQTQDEKALREWLADASQIRSNLQPPCL